MTATLADFLRVEQRPTPKPVLPNAAAILRAAVGIGLYAGAFGIAYGAVAVGSGLSVAQAMVLSLVMFSGASQFAFVGVVAAGGSPFAAIPAALLLGVRNAFYGVPMSEILQPRGVRRLVDRPLRDRRDHGDGRSASRRRPAKRYAFWATGLILFSLWQLGSLTGALLGRAIDPADFGLDAAAPAVYPGPALADAPAPETRRLVAVGRRRAGAGPGPDRPPGVPVVAAAAVAWWPDCRAGRRVMTALWVAVVSPPSAAICSSWPGCRCPSRC